MASAESVVTQAGGCAGSRCGHSIPLADDLALEMSEIFRALSDPTRLRIVSVLVCGDLSVGELAASVEMSVSAVSHQLRLLRNLRIVKRRRRGRKVIYSMDDEHVVNIYCYAFAHLGHT